MSESPLREENIDSVHLLSFFYKWRKTLLAIGVLSALSSAGISFIIPEKYKSTVILFPAPPVSVAKSLMAHNVSSNADLLQFGEEDDMERMLQVLNSEEIRNKIIERYKLEEHYGIAPDDKYRKTRLRQKYDENIQFKKTEYMSVKIEVLDHVPEMASNIANDIAALYDSTMIRMKRERAVDAFKIVEKEYNLLQQEIRTKEDSLHKLMLLGVNDYESQAERLNEALGRAIVEGKAQAVQVLEHKIKMLSTYGTSYMALRDELYRLREQLNMLKEKYEQAKVDAQQTISEKFVVDRAFPAEKKSYPIRWLIVTVSTVSSLIIALLVIALMENIKKIQQSIGKA